MKINSCYDTTSGSRPQTWTLSLFPDFYIAANHFKIPGFMWLVTQQVSTLHIKIPHQFFIWLRKIKLFYSWFDSVHHRKTVLISKVMHTTKQNVYRYNWCQELLQFVSSKFKASVQFSSVQYGAGLVLPRRPRPLSGSIGHPQRKFS